jgi:magnesium chelatase family protein
MAGLPGEGKNLPARVRPGILLRLTIEDALDVTSICSVVDQLPPDIPLILNRLFRLPYHNINHSGLVGDDIWSHPGEI